MIQIYDGNTTDFSNNGTVIFPTLCRPHVILNSAWELTLEHPIDREGRWKQIVEESIVKCPSFNGEQLWRIKQKKKGISYITATAEPIFMDAKEDCFLLDVRPTVKNGQEAIDIMTASNRKYVGHSNITKTSTAYYNTKNLIEAINGDDENSYINRWGGEILFDNYNVTINERIGGDYGVQILYGKNIEADGIAEDVNDKEIITRIVPKSYNGYMMSGNSPWVDSPLLNAYPTVKYGVLKFEDVKMKEDEQEGDREKGITICDTQAQLNAALRKKCQEQYDLGIDKPKVTISVKMAMTRNTVNYKDYKEIEEVKLGDTVYCKHHKLDISVEARVIELVYDSIRNQIYSVVIGAFKYNYFDNVSSTVNRIDAAIRSDGTIVAEQIKGVIDGMTAKLKAMKDIAQKQDVRAILFEDVDTESPTYGAMALGTAGFEIAEKRTADGRDWAWSTFGTAQGFYATYLIAGILSSRNWISDAVGFMLDLDHGTINSKHLKLDEHGVMRIYQAIIEGGSFTVNYNNNGMQTPMFAVNGNGVGIGPGGQLLTYYAGDSFMTLGNELRILSGRLTGYAANGQKGIEMDRTMMHFYAWNDAGNYVGSIGATKRTNSDRVGIDMWCDAGDMLAIGYKKPNDNIIYPKILIDANDMEQPPWILGTASGKFSAISGLAWDGNGKITRVDRVTANIKHGFMQSWSTESSYY